MFYLNSNEIDMYLFFFQIKEQEAYFTLKNDLKQKELSLAQANTIKEEQKMKHSELLTVVCTVYIHLC